MKKQIVFIQGGGYNGYDDDKSLVRSLQQEIGNNYTVLYPKLTSDESAPDFGWLKEIEKEIAKIKSDFFIVAHSLGASMVLKFLSENPATKNIKGVFLIATPFWSGTEDWKQGLKLKEKFEEHLPIHIPFFLYYAKDDEEVPFSHFNKYKRKMPEANFHERNTGGHQFDHNLTLIANDITSL